MNKKIIIITENKTSKIKELQNIFKIKSSPEVIKKQMLQGKTFTNKNGLEITLVEDYDVAYKKIKHKRFDLIIDNKADTLSYIEHAEKIMKIKLGSLQKGIDCIIIEKEKRR